MQIVIDIPEMTFESVKRYYEQNQDCYALCAYVATGTPLTDVLGEIRAEIKERKTFDEYTGESILAVEFKDNILDIIDKYSKEQKE